MRILTYAVMIYMSMALIWWTILLSKNNEALYQSKVEQIDRTQVNYDTEVATLKAHHDRKAKMILGEGLVFGFMLIIGLYLIQKMFNKELDNIHRQNNFLLSITHELKSPIASVNLITETLQKRDLDKTHQNQLLENILSESTRLEKLINNLLLSAKLQTHYVYNFESTDITGLVADQVKRLTNMFTAARITFLQSDPVFAGVDREAFVSVISNILENAIKYGGAQPNIEVLVHRVHDKIEIEVKDQGIGISQIEKTKIFDQFYRVGHEETRTTKGTGLGLYIAKKIVIAHGGKIEVADNIPRGSTFTITLPAA